MKRGEIDREKLEGIFEAMDEGILYQEVEKGILWFNPAAERITGIKASELEGRESNEPLWQVVDEDGALLPHSEFLTRRTLETGEPLLRQVRGLVRPGHPTRWLCLSSLPITRPGSERPHAVVVTFTDVTTNRRTEASLRISEDKFRLLFLSSPDGVFLTTPDGSISAANPAACRMFGYKAEEIVRKQRKDIVDTGDGRLARLLAQREKNGYVRGECTCLRKGGDPFPVELSSSIYRDERGEMMACVLVRDITERKAAEKDRLLNEARLQVALAAVDIAVFQQDRDLRYTWVFQPQGGLEPGQVIGRTDADLLPASVAQHVTAIKQAVLSTGVGTRQEVEIEGAEGVSTYVLVMEPIFDESGVVTGLAGSSLDITQAKRDTKRKNDELVNQAQRLQELNAALRVLLDQREQERRDMESRLISDLDKLVKPHLVGLASMGLTPRQTAHLEAALGNLGDLGRGFCSSLSLRFRKLTPRELQVAQMVREGKSSKEAARMMGLSVRSVDFYRMNLRRKLGLGQKKINLRNYLLSIE